MLVSRQEGKGATYSDQDFAPPVPWRSSAGETSGTSNSTSTFSTAHWAVQRGLGVIRALSIDQKTARCAYNGSIATIGVRYFE